MKLNCTFASALSLICDCALALIKFIVGVSANSHSLVSDAVHSCADAFSCVVVLLGISAKNSRKDVIRENAYIIERASLILLSVILIITGLGIGFDGIKTVFFNQNPIDIPDVYALWVALFALIIKEMLFIYNIKVANKTKNELIKANAWHHQSDALSCLGSFIGIAGARLGYAFFDPMTSIAISLLIIKVGLKILMGAIKENRDGAS